jgi:hypothetical protein
MNDVSPTSSCEIDSAAALRKRRLESTEQYQYEHRLR